MSRSALAALALTVVTVVVAGCGGSHSTSSSASTRTLTDLHNISQLQKAFNTASGEPRLIVLVSPT